MEQQRSAATAPYRSAHSGTALAVLTLPIGSPMSLSTVLSQQDLTSIISAAIELA